MPSDSTAAPIRNFARAVASWSGIIGFVAAQQFDEKFRGSRVATLVAFTEPLILILVLVMIRGLFRENLPNYGTSLFVFYSSGVFPFYMYLRLSVRARSAPYDASSRFPRVSNTDMVIASTISEVSIVMSTMVIWFGAMWMFGLSEAAPVSIADCLAPLSLFVVLGVGVGLLNSAMSRRFRIWQFLYARATYGLMFLSGVFYVVDLLPLSIRNVLVWNPLVHGIEWFRLGLYGHYLTHTLDRGYLVLCAGIALFVGLVTHRVTIRWERQ